MAVADASGKKYFQVSRGGADAWLTERERREQGRSYPNFCAEGHQNLLITAFDALTGVTTRSLDTLLVHRATGVMRLAPIKQSFGTSTALPRYSSAPTLPRSMAARLGELTPDTVQKLLGDLLTKRQIKALLVRRDKILQWPLTPTRIPSISAPSEPGQPAQAAQPVQPVQEESSL